METIRNEFHLAGLNELRRKFCFQSLNGRDYSACVFPADPFA